MGQMVCVLKNMATTEVTLYFLFLKEGCLKQDEKFEKVIFRGPCLLLMLF